MKRKLVEIIVRNFECQYCGGNEYFVVDPYSDKRLICCDKCGKIQENVEYEVKNELLRNKIIKKFKKVLTFYV